MKWLFTLFGEVGNVFGEQNHGLRRKSDVSPHGEEQNGNKECYSTQSILRIVAWLFGVWAKGVECAEKQWIGIVLIMVIALCIYANKHRAEKKENQLNRSLVEGDVKSPAV